MEELGSICVGCDRRRMHFGKTWKSMEIQVQLSWEVAYEWLDRYIMESLHYFCSRPTWKLENRPHMIMCHYPARPYPTPPNSFWHLEVSFAKALFILASHRTLLASEPFSVWNSNELVLLWMPVHARYPLLRALASASHISVDIGRFFILKRSK